VLHDLMLAAPKLGVNVRVCTPLRHRPSSAVVSRTRSLAAQHGTDLFFTDDPVEGVAASNVVVTDTWVSMGQEAEAAVRLREFEGYRVTSKLMAQAAPGAIFMHCLPRHPEEVSDEVFYSDRSVVWDEAENRMYTVQAVMLTMLGVTL
jgi:ornithine carbamoyltransferase